MNNFRGEKGRYSYMGFLNKLTSIASKHILLKKFLTTSKKLTVILSTDGVSMHNVSMKRTSLWPIAAKIVSHVLNFQPITFGMFEGSSKPSERFLKDLATELNCLSKSDMEIRASSSLTLSIEFQCLGFSADSPARVLCKRVVACNGKFGCERCNTPANYVNRRMVFSKDLGPKRTNSNFRNMEFPLHHKGGLPLLCKVEKLDMVSDFFLDPLHLSDEGVCKRLCNFYFVKTGNMKMPTNMLNQISEDIESLNSLKCKDFQRKLPTLQYFSQWKATNYRDFLLYFGPVLLKDKLSKQHYTQFLRLSCAHRILRNRRQVRVAEALDSADRLLSDFVSNHDECVGRPETIYCVHSLLHLTDDCRKTRLPLDDFSTYAFESEWGKLKKLVKSATVPIAQLEGRLYERESMFKMHKLFFMPPECDIRKGSIVCVRCKYMTLVPKSKNDCFLVTKIDKRIFKLLKVEINCANFVLTCTEIMKVKPFFNKPVCSSTLGIFKVRIPEIPAPVQFDISCVLCKCILLPCKSYFVSFPLLHTL